MTGIAPITADQAVETLTTEGYDRGDVLTLIDQLSVEGYHAEQPDEGGPVLDEADLATLRAQLDS